MQLHIWRACIKHMGALKKEKYIQVYIVKNVALFPQCKLMLLFMVHVNLRAIIMFYKVQL